MCLVENAVGLDGSKERNHTERDDDDVIKVISVTNYFYDMTCNDKKI